jgi:hypothetical protein
MTSSFLRPGWRQYTLALLSRSGRHGPLQDKNPARPNHTNFMACDYNIELVIKESKSGLHLGQMQVTGDADRVARSVALPVCAYSLLVRLYGREEAATKSWSLFQLKQRFTADIMHEEVQRTETKWQWKLRQYKQVA